jgi:Cu/Zn superoxide dismutase
MQKVLKVSFNFPYQSSKTDQNYKNFVDVLRFPVVGGDSTSVSFFHPPTHANIGLVTANLKGLSPGKHGVHIHEKAVSGFDCGSTGGHYNPTGEHHGSEGSVRLWIFTRYEQQ